MPRPRDFESLARQPLHPQQRTSIGGCGFGCLVPIAEVATVYAVSEKLEIIRLVEQSHLPDRRYGIGPKDLYIRVGTTHQCNQLVPNSERMDFTNLR